MSAKRRFIAGILSVAILLFLAACAGAAETESPLSAPEYAGLRIDADWAVKPAFRGQPNLLQARIRSGGDNAAAEPPETLPVRVSHAESGLSRIYYLRPAPGRPGLYQREIIPDLGGDYQVRTAGADTDAELAAVYDAAGTEFSLQRTGRDRGTEGGSSPLTTAMAVLIVATISVAGIATIVAASRLAEKLEANKKNEKES